MKIEKFNERFSKIGPASDSEMNISKDTKVKVKHLIEYLSKFNPETTVGLDKDGWMDKFIKHTNELDLIEKRGLFDYFEDHLTINN